MPDDGGMRYLTPAFATRQPFALKLGAAQPYMLTILARTRSIRNATTAQAKGGRKRWISVGGRPDGGKRRACQITNTRAAFRVADAKPGSHTVVLRRRRGTAQLRVQVA